MIEVVMVKGRCPVFAVQNYSKLFWIVRVFLLGVFNLVNIPLTVTIKNISTDAVSVCNYKMGVLHVESFKKDGRKVRGEEGIAFDSYEEPFEWVEHLVVLQPEQTVAMSYTLQPAFGVAGSGPTQTI